MEQRDLEDDAGCSARYIKIKLPVILLPVSSIPHLRKKEKPL